MYALRVFSGVFQAVREFLIVRQPERLLLPSEYESLACLYQGYLERQNTELHTMGYTVEEPVSANSLTGFQIVKATPSEWRN